MINISNIKITGRLNGTTLGPTERYWVASIPLFQPNDITFDNSESIYVVGGYNNYSAIIKLSPEGDLDWQKTTTQLSATQYRRVLFNNENINLLLLAGSVAKRYMFSFDSLGNLVDKEYFSHSYGSSDSIDDAFNDSQGNIYMLGIIDLGTGTGQDIVLLKINQAGSVLWQKRFYKNVLKGDRGYSGATIGDYIYISNVSFDDFANTFIKLTSSGSIVWQKKIPISGESDMSSDGSYIYFASANNNNPYILKMDQDGNIVWQKYINITGSFQSIKNDGSGNLYVAVSTSAGSTTSNDVILMKLSGNGNIVWQKRLSTAGTDSSPTVSLSENSLVVSFRSASTTAVIAKLPLDGSVVGTYGPLTISDSSFSLNSASLTVSEGNLLIGNTTVVNGTTNITFSNSAFVTTTTDIN